MVLTLFQYFFVFLAIVFFVICTSVKQLSRDNKLSSVFFFFFSMGNSTNIHCLFQLYIVGLRLVVLAFFDLHSYIICTKVMFLSLPFLCLFSISFLSYPALFFTIISNRRVERNLLDFCLYLQSKTPVLCYPLQQLLATQGDLNSNKRQIKYNEETISFSVTLAPVLRCPLQQLLAAQGDSNSNKRQIKYKYEESISFSVTLAAFKCVISCT